MTGATRALAPRASFALLQLACMLGANRVAARVAFDHGVATAVAVRSLATAAGVAAIVRLQRIAWRMSPRHRRVLPLLGARVAVQSPALLVVGAVTALGLRRR